MTQDFSKPPLAPLVDTLAPDGLRAALAAFARGAMLIVTDDDGRENEGDLIMSAVHCRPADMAFIVRHTSGIVCTPLTPDIAARLDLPPMVARNDAPFATAFTVSVDWRQGTTTGISATDRCATVHGLADPAARPADFVRPGHIFPLVARPGGVLERDGHTEAAVDLCRLTGLPPVGVICELVNDDGTVMRGPDLAAFAARHDLHRITIAQLIALRRAIEADTAAIAAQ